MTGGACIFAHGMTLVGAVAGGLIAHRRPGWCRSKPMATDIILIAFAKPVHSSRDLQGNKEMPGFIQVRQKQAACGLLELGQGRPVKRLE